MQKATKITIIEKWFLVPARGAGRFPCGARAASRGGGKKLLFYDKNCCKASKNGIISKVTIPTMR
jgi:hypothetical protein